MPTPGPSKSINAAFVPCPLAKIGAADLIVGSGLRADATIRNGRALPGYTQINLAAVQVLRLPGLKPRRSISTSWASPSAFRLV